MVARAAKNDVPEFVEGADVTESPDGWEWDTVVEGAPTKVIFDTVGDVFIGQFKGKEHVENEPAADGTDRSFDHFIFRGRDGERYSVPSSYSLVEALTDEVIDKWVRLTFLKEIPTARNLSPMKDFKVDIKR